MNPFIIQKRYDYRGRLIYWGKSIKIDGGGQKKAMNMMKMEKQMS